MKTWCLIFFGMLATVGAVTSSVVPTPRITADSGAIQVKWQGKGTLYAATGSNVTTYSQVTAESPYTDASPQDRWYKVAYDVLNYTVIDTNQAVSYDADGSVINPSPAEPYYGQDAVYSGNQPSYTDNGDGTVTDNHTGLMWQQVPPEAFYSWEAAQEYAENLVLAGYDDWRLPTMKESISLADFTGSSRPEIDQPYINTEFFTMYDPLAVGTYVPTSAENPNRPKRNIDGQFWSSNAYVGRTINDNTSTFGFNFIDGRIKSYPNGFSGPTGTSFVRCVRGNESYGINNFVDNGDGTVTDLATGLMWLKGDSGDTLGALDWIAALEWSEEFEYAGYDDWRLPNPKELHSIVDYTRAPDAEDPEMRTAAIDPIFDVTETESWYWTSTSLGDDLFEWAIYICFGQATAVDTVTGEASINAHGAGAMRSDPKTGDPLDFIDPETGGHGPQNDEVRIQNYVRPVRTAFTKQDIEARPTQPNILLLIVDDWGIDSSGLYNESPLASQPPTPIMDAVASDGLVFRNAFAQPTCSPTRANILTGRYSFRHGVGAPAMQQSQLVDSEFTLPEAFAAADSEYALASFGKWHLTIGGGDLANAGRPNTIGGWPHYQGDSSGNLEDYYNWDKTTNGSIEYGVTEYATSVTVDDALSWIAQQGESPWLCWIGFNAGHVPFHRPPLDPALHSYTELPEDPTGANRRPAYEAAIEAMDTEIGRLLEGIDLSNTNVIILGDNGTPVGVVQDPYDRDHAKGTLYEGGTHVPMIISGPSVTTNAKETEALVHCVDLFATCLEMAGIDPSAVVPESTAIDSESLMGILAGSGTGKPFVLLENFGGDFDEGRAVRDDRYKYIVYTSGTEEFYDLTEDPNEQINLLNGTLSDEATIRLADLQAAVASFQ